MADARGVLLIALLPANEHRETAIVRAQLQERCTEPARDAHTQLVKIACARADRDAAALAEGAAALSGFRDVMPWQRRIVERWRAQLAVA